MTTFTNGDLMTTFTNGDLMATKEKLGALWLRTDKNGSKFMSGKINGIDIVVFKNGFKDADSKPDYIIYKSQPVMGPHE